MKFKIGNLIEMKHDYDEYWALMCSSSGSFTSIKQPNSPHFLPKSGIILKDEKYNYDVFSLKDGKTIKVVKDLDTIKDASIIDMPFLYADYYYEKEVKLMGSKNE